jgi:hypothetical protein
VVVGNWAHKLRTSSITVDFVCSITNFDTFNEAIDSKELLSHLQYPKKYIYKERKFPNWANLNVILNQRKSIEPKCCDTVIEAMIMS